MGLFQDVRQSLGNFVDTAGGYLGIPETGISERIAGGPTTNTAPNQAYAYEGGQSTAPNQSVAPGGIYDQNGNQIGSSSTYQTVNVPTSSGGSSGGGSSSGGSSSTGGSVDGTQNVDYFINEFGQRQAITDNPNSKYFNQDSILSEINNIFSEVNDYLGRSESRVREGLDPALAGVASQYNDSAQQLQTGVDQTNRLLDENRISTQQRRLEADNANARLLDELRRGSLQRFGGASSAGQAATELANVEAQRRSGQTQQDFGTAMRSIDQQAVQVEEDYNNRLSQLKTQRQLAENQIQSEFRDRIQQIDNMRAEAAQNKGAMKLQALQNLRNQMFQLQLQETQFQQSLAAMREQANIQLQAQRSSLAQAGSTATGAFNTFAGQASVNPGTQYSVNPAMNGGQTTQLTGSINRNEDLIGQGYIPGSSDRDPRFANYVPAQ